MDQQTSRISPDGYWLWDGARWVQNPYRPAALPAVSAPYESARDRALLATIFIGLAVFTHVVNYVVILIAESNRSEAMTAMLSLAELCYYASFITAVVFFCMWLHRIVRNMPALGSPDLASSPGWSVGQCFIPFVNFVQPLLSVLDAWRGSDASGRWLDRPARKRIPVPGVIVAWWIFWLLRLAGSVAINGYIPNLLLDLAALATVVSGIAVLRIIRQLTDRQDRKSELIASGQLV